MTALTDTYLRPQKKKIKTKLSKTKKKTLRTLKRNYKPIDIHIQTYKYVCMLVGID